MKFSLRTLLIFLFLTAIVLAIGSRKYLKYRWYNHEVATIDIEGGLKVRLWTSTFEYRSQQLVDAGSDTPIEVTEEKTGRVLFMEVWQDGTLLHPERMIYHDLRGETNRLQVHYSNDKKAASISTVSNPEFLIFADLEKNDFGTPETIFQDDYDESIPLDDYADLATCLQVQFALAGNCCWRSSGIPIPTC